MMSNDKMKINYFSLTWINIDKYRGSAIQTMIFIGGENLALRMLCNETPAIGLLFFTVKINIAKREKLF